MLIKQFWFVAAICFWMYILVCICVKLVLDHKRSCRKQEEKYEIREFFTAGNDGRADKGKFQSIQKYVEDENMFAYACKCYAEAMRTCSLADRSAMESYIRIIVHARIKSVELGDAIGRCLILRAVLECSLHSEQIDRFKAACRHGCGLEKAWAAAKLDDCEMNMAR